MTNAAHSRLGGFLQMFRLNRAQVQGLIVFMVGMFAVVSWSIISDAGWGLKSFLAIGLSLVVMLISMIVCIPIGLALRRTLFGDDQKDDDAQDEEYVEDLRNERVSDGGRRLR